MGNGQAPGTATGLGMAGAGVAVTGFGALRRWTAGLAVFFFAAFLLAGFLAGFFLPDLVVAGLPSAADFLLLADFCATARFADFGADFFLVAFFLVALFFAAFFAAFFAFAMITSGCVYG